MSAEEAIARAKAIAARLSGTGATAATTPDAPSTPAASSVPVSNNDVSSVADAALAAAFGGGADAGKADEGASSGSKRKRWDTGGGKLVIL